MASACPLAKVDEDLICVYNVGLFEFEDGSGFLEHVAVCQFVNSLFKSLGSIEFGLVSEGDLEKDEDPELLNSFSFILRGGLKGAVPAVTLNFYFRASRQSTASDACRLQLCLCFPSSTACVCLKFFAGVLLIGCLVHIPALFHKNH